MLVFSCSTISDDAAGEERGESSLDEWRKKESIGCGQSLPCSENATGLAGKEDDIHQINVRDSVSVYVLYLEGRRVDNNEVPENQ